MQKSSKKTPANYKLDVSSLEVHNGYSRDVATKLLLACITLSVGCVPSSNHLQSEIQTTDHFLRTWSERADTQRKLTATEIEKNSIGTREVAEALPYCAKDRINSTESLKREIEQLEVELGSARVGSSTWKGVDLSKFTPMQMRFINEGGKFLLAPSDSTFTQCTNVPCILDKLYPSTARNAGLKHYLFYLRTGYYLNTLPQVPYELSKKLATPTQYYTGTKSPDYLYTSTELDAFYRMAAALPKAMVYLNSLNGFYRAPASLALPEYANGSTACGDYSPPLNYVRFQKECLDVTANLDPYDLESNFLFETVPHEMTHALDWQMGTKMGQGNYFSRISSEWLSLSGWVRKEVVSSGVTKLAWTFSPSKSNQFLLRIGEDLGPGQYAKTNPPEDFAVHSSYYRFGGKRIWEQAPTKAEYLKNKVYLGRVYTVDGQRAYFTSQLSRKIELNTDIIVKPCINHGSAPSSKIDSVSSLSGYKLTMHSSLPKSTLDCVQHSYEQFVNKEIFKLNLNDYDACDAFNKSSSPILTQVTATASPLFEKALQNSKAVVAQNDSLREFQDKLRFEIDPREYFIVCLSAKDPKACYNSTLSSNFSVIADPYKNRISTLENEKKIYLDATTYEKTETSMRELFSTLFSGVTKVTADVAEERWDKCLKDSTQSDSGTNTTTSSTSTSSSKIVNMPLTAPFSGGTQYVSKSILDCINAASKDDYQHIIQGQLKRLGLSVGNSNLYGYMYGQLMPKFTSTLQSLVLTASNEEQEKAIAIAKTATDKLVAKMKSDTSWTSGISDSTYTSTCLKLTVPTFKSEFASASIGSFTQVDGLSKNRATEVCKTLQTDPAIKSKVNKG